MSDPTNDDRAEWAELAIDTFAKATGMRSERNDEDDETILGDLLTDLRHWAAANGVDFDAICAGSAHTFAEEVEEYDAEEVEEYDE